MIDSRVGYSAPTVTYVSETYRHCIQYLLLRWFNLPSGVPANEGAEIRDDIRRTIQFLLDDLESSVPGMGNRLVCEMRGLAELIATPFASQRPCDLATMSG